MKFKLVLIAAASACLVSVADAQAACPTPDLLQGVSISAEQFFETLAGPSITKGEFETTAEFEARLATVERPAAAVVEVHTKPDNFTYDADAQAFKFLVHTVDPRTTYQRGYASEAIQSLLGDYNYGMPVHLRTKKVELEGGEYVATNAYGAETAVAEVKSIEYVMFDNKGRKKSAGGDDLFTERKKYEMPGLMIPVSRDLAAATKDGLRMVAYAEPKAPWATEVRHRSEPTRNFPTDRSTTYKIAFADIKCVGVLNAEGQLLAHWVTR